jgi:hypothetical protein
MTMQTARDPEDDVPQLKKYGVSLSLNDFVTALLDKAQIILDATATPTLAAGGAAAIPSEAQPHVQRIKDLAGELKAEIDAISAIDPDLLNRMKQG